MRTRHFTGCIVGLLLTFALFAEPSRQARDRYQAEWAEIEKQAVGEVKQMELAVRLYAAAQNEADRDMKVILCEKAYEYGAKHRETYGSAGNALLTLQQIDPSRRLECLEKLAPLYNKAYYANANKNLGNGIGLATVTYQMAQQRINDLAILWDAQGVEHREFFKHLNQAKREYQSADQVAAKVLATAERYAGRVSGASQKALLSFIAQNKPLTGQIEAGQKELAELQKDYLAGAPSSGGKAEPPTVADATPPKPVPAPDKPQPKPDKGDRRIDPLPRGELADPTKPLIPPDPPAGEAKPDADPPVADADPAPAPDAPAPKVRPSAKSGLSKRMKDCSSCNNRFIPEYGSTSDKCFWCSKSKGIFSLEGAEK